MRINQKCGGCGSTQEIETGNDKLAEQLAKRWEAKHRPHIFHKPVPYWPTQPYITWTSGASRSGQATYSVSRGTSSATTRSTTQDEEW